MRVMGWSRSVLKGFSISPRIVTRQLFTGPSGSDSQKPSPLPQWTYDHVPSSLVEKFALAVGASVVSIMDTHRADMVGVVGETTGALALNAMHQQMLATQEGSMVLREKPRVLPPAVDVAHLSRLPSNTFGFAYARFMSSHGYDPASRSAVRFVDNPELAYVMQRYREVHDFWHVLSGLPTSVLGEVAQKWLEMLQTGLPMCALSSVVGPLRLSSADKRLLLQHYIPWAFACHTSIQSRRRPLVSVHYEKYFEVDIDTLREELGVLHFDKWASRKPHGAQRASTTAEQEHI